MKLTSKEEDYLETIYRLSLETDTVGISDIARNRNVTLPTVVSAVSRLKESGLVSQRHYGKIFLSPDGKKMAVDIYRTHKAIRLFLTEVLQISSTMSEIEACKLEHAISSETRQRLVAFVETFQNCAESKHACRENYLKNIDKTESDNRQS